VSRLFAKDAAANLENKPAERLGIKILSVVSKSHVDTFILAGDNSSRMDRHKALLDFAGVPLIVGLRGGAKMVGSKATKAVDWALAIVLPKQHRYWGISNER